MNQIVVVFTDEQMDTIMTQLDRVHFFSTSSQKRFFPDALRDRDCYFSGEFDTKNKQIGLTVRGAVDAENIPTQFRITSDSAVDPETAHLLDEVNSVLSAAF